MDGYGFGVDFLFVFQIKIRDDEIKATSNGEKKRAEQTCETFSS